jgi:YesN/AraC family two-component response regulator
MKNTVFPIVTENEQRLPFYVFGIGLDHNQEHIIRPQGYPCYQWILSRSGTGHLVVNGTEYHLAKDQGMVLLPDEPHEYYAENNEWVVDWISLSGSGVENFFKQAAGIEQSGIFFVTDPEAIHESMGRILAAEQTQNPLRAYDVSAQAYLFVMDLLKNISTTTANSLATRYNRLTPVLDYIDEHYAESITLKKLSDLLNVTPQHLCTLFRKIMNTRIFEYINLVRIKKSKEFLLAQPNLAIRDIAHLNGFEDVSYFCYIFKRVEKITPGDFRKLYMK